MPIIRKINSAFKRLIKYPQSLKRDRLVGEVERELFIQRNQIDYWYQRYKNEKNPLCHPYIEIAQLYTNAAMHERASEFYLRFLDKRDDKLVHALYLQNLLLSASATNQSLLKAHQDWAKKYDKPSEREGWELKLERKEQHKKLKIGYLCHFFANSISESCLLPFFKLHDRNKFSVYCYDDGDTPVEFQSCADRWRDIRGLSDKQVADLIKQDGIDIVQEMNGFCFLNRFDALSRRPAPIQINWYNHASTTGLPYIDYVMSDRISIQDEDLPYYVEEAYRTPQFIAAKQFDPNRFGKIVGEAPCVNNDFITFCYFGSSHKISLQSIHLWCRILHNVPQSRLILKSGTFSHDLYRQIFTKHFLQQGIDERQLVFEGWSDHASTLQKYNSVDIMLDNVPVSGGSTLFEALTQGVPAVSMMGDRWAARSGASSLTALQHPELIAKTADEYVAIACKLAGDISALNHYRQSFREDMLSSPLLNIPQFYKNFEAAYLYMWNNWCKPSGDSR